MQTHDATLNGSANNAPALDLGDIYYTLFRHKWKIIICTLVGLAAAAAVYKLTPPPYQSETKLFIRYVIAEGKSLGPGGDDSVKLNVDQRGETIINSEIEILTSLDLAIQVAKNVGPEKILAKINGGKDSIEAASVVRGGLSVDVPPKSSVIRLVFRHPDPEVVQVVLREMVDAYLKKHREVHSVAGMAGDFLAQQTDDLRSRLLRTEEELNKVTNKAGVVSVDDAKKSYSEQISRIRQEIFDTQADLVERSSILQIMTKQNATGTDDATKLAPPPQDKIDLYQKISVRLDLLQRRDQDLSTQFTDESPRVKEVRAMIAETSEQKRNLENDFPALTRLRIAITPGPGGGGKPSDFDPLAQAANVAALQAKLKILNTQMESVRTEISKLEDLEGSIHELTRQKELEDANYRYYSSSLEKSRVQEALGGGGISNINQVETPTPPHKDWKKTYQIIGGIAGSGLALGLIWAFLIEFYFDRSIRRPADIERRLKLPLFLTVPMLGRRHRLKLANHAPSSTPVNGNASTALAAPQSQDHPPLDPFYETLRDRLISYFESINLTHKPKLVAVTGLGQNAGVTTTAASLARSFSETGEGNVLLVDMTQGQGSAQHFHKGKSMDGLEQMFLFDSKSRAQVHDNLYVVSESPNNARLAKGMPHRFNQMLPRLKASDFDYIIFDMPAVSQISVTPRIAGAMDMVLMVLESEKTDRDTAQRAAALLKQSNPNVGAILNKSKSYVPASLHQDREFFLGS
jgi:polysaccharide biosynthesis transport protein